MTQKHSLFAGLIFFIFAVTNAANADFVFVPLGDGWSALAKRTDPFNEDIVRLEYISKDGFKFKCDAMDFVTHWYRYDSFRRGSRVAFKIDNNDPVTRGGITSTGSFGSEIITDDRHYSTQLRSSEIEQMKRGAELKVAGALMDTWQTKSLDLRGFTHAYGVLCE